MTDSITRVVRYGCGFVCILALTIHACAVFEPPRPSATASQPKSATLRAAARARGLLIGAAVFPEGLRDERYAETLAREFNYLTPENVMKWGLIHPEPERWDFAPADKLVEFAAKNGMKVKGHALVWHEQLPQWVNADMSAEALRRGLRGHVRTLVERYRGRVFAWDVVNEAVDDEQGMRKTLFLEKLGEGYIADAFRWAHEVDPQALLIYNDYGAEGASGKSDRVYTLVKKLVDASAPISGVGLQMHIAATRHPKPADIAANVRRLAALGLKINISEMDVRIKDVPGSPAEKLETQRRVIHDILSACMREPGFDAVTFWGFTDAHSWVDSFFGPDDPLPFDEQYRPKPAYEGIRAALLGR